MKKRSMKLSISKILLLLVFGVILIMAVLFDGNLAIGLLMAVFLSAITLFVFRKYGKISGDRIYFLCCAIFLIHFSVVILTYYANFRPVGGGADFEGYNQSAIEIAKRFSQSNFSLEGVYSKHYFPVLIGLVYMSSAPEMIIGQMFAVWLAVLTVLAIYALVIEMGGSEKQAFFAGAVISIYPSYLYFGSLLLKDTVVIPLVIFGLLLSVKIIKDFKAYNLLWFFAVLTGLIHLRFYVGFAIMFSFIICWFLIANLNWQDKIIYGAAFIFLLGFSPQVLGYGYYGSSPLKGYLNTNMIKTYREVVYAPSDASRDKSAQSISVGAGKVKEDDSGKVKEDDSGKVKEDDSGRGSSFTVKSGVENPLNFTKNYAESFVYSLLGPFPWQLKQKRHLFFLAETIPWWALSFFAVFFSFKKIKKQGITIFLQYYKFVLPLLLFSLMALGALSLYINNFGIIARIRISMFVSLTCAMAMVIDFPNNFFKKIILKLKRLVI